MASHNSLGIELEYLENPELEKYLKNQQQTKPDRRKAADILITRGHKEKDIRHLLGEEADAVLGTNTQHRRCSRDNRVRRR